MGLALARDGWQVSDHPVGLRGQPRAAVFPRQEGCDGKPCSPWVWGQLGLSPPASGSPATHPSALYWLVPGMPAPCCTMAGLNVVAAFRAFIALSFLL